MTARQTCLDSAVLALSLLDSGQEGHSFGFECLETRLRADSVAVIVLCSLLRTLRPPIISSLKAPQRAFTLMLPAPYTADLCQFVGDLLKSNVRRQLARPDNE
jgi:hypothetical protein